MNPVVRFLHALAQALSAVGLYGAGHAARERALDEVVAALEPFLAEAGRLDVSFLKGQVVTGEGPLRDMRGWPLAARLAESGIERIEVRNGIDREEIAAFVVRLSAQLGTTSREVDEEDQVYAHIRYGRLERSETADEGVVLDLNEQGALASDLFDQVRRSLRVPLPGVSVLMRSLQGAMGSGDSLVVPQIPHDGSRGYISVRSMNTSILALAFATWMELESDEIQTIAEAALLYDIGKVTVPVEILEKPDSLTDEEWVILCRHPVAGARILLRSAEELGLAAVAAYEHHLDLDGTGYPDLHFPRTPHRISQVVRLCDVFDAMRTRRHYEAAQPLSAIVKVFREGSGTKFAPDLVETFARMLLGWSDRFIDADAGQGLV